MNSDAYNKHQQELFQEIKDKARCDQPMRLEPPAPFVELSTDLCNLRIFLAEAVTKIEAGGKSRPRSLAITKLQEASFWLNEEIRTS